MSTSGSRGVAWSPVAAAGPTNPFLENGFSPGPGGVASLSYRSSAGQLQLDGVVTCPAIASGGSAVLCHLPAQLITSLERWWGGSLYCDDNAAGRIFRLKFQTDGAVVLTLVGTAINAGALLTVTVSVRATTP